MKKLARIGFCLALCLVMTVPAFAQGGENAAWQAIEDQRDLRRQAELLESFVKSYANSAHRPEADFKLVQYYVSNNDHAKIMNHAEGFRTNLPSADASAKTKMFQEAMFAAYQLKNIPKVVEFAGYSLQADPNNLTVLTLLARANLPDPAKAVEHANKALLIPRPATMTPDAYEKNQGYMHAIVAFPLFQQQKFAEAQEHLSIALKTNPKDQAAQFQYGFISVNLAGVSAKDAQEANNNLVRAMTATPTVPADVDAAKAKVEAASKQALVHRDNAIDALAKAVALGSLPTGSNPGMTAEAKRYLDAMFTNKNGSLTGEDQLIADKKKELGL
jgi:tetratricopeptide (TPR) repeat protein